MNFKCLIILLLSNFYILQSQSIKPVSNLNSGSISGKVLDKNSKQPIEFVNITILEGTKIITGGITQANGSFSIKNIPFQDYIIEFQFIGYKKQSITISLNNNSKTIILNTIFLEEEAVELQGVNIVKDRSTIEQKIDRKIINVGKDLISAGATASDIMNNIPSVSVDPQTKSISLRGNENVRVLIDGKPSNIDVAQLLQQIPSASIKQIELITNPSAKYNPEGMSGIINIVLYKNSKLGFNGSINNGVTFGITPKLNSALDLNYRNGKFNLFGNYGFNTGKNANNGFIKSFEVGKENYQDFKFGNENTSHLIKLGIDFYINDKNTISFYTNQNIYRNSGFGRNDVNYFDDLANNDILQVSSNNNKDNSQTYNFDYKLNFKKEGHNLELEINYNKNKSPESSIFSYPNTSITLNNEIEKIGKNSIINLDYTNPLSETIKLEIGLEARNESTNNSFYINTLYNSDFDFKRSIYSGYGTIGKQWKKWSFQAGTRVEQYDVEANFRKKNEVASKFNDAIFTLYPSAFLTYNQSDKNTFNLNYSRRVDRPSIQQINPIREWSTPTIDSEGNPNLTPQFTNSFELNFTRKTGIGSVTSGVFYRKINNEIVRVVYSNPDNPNKRVLSYTNFDDNDAYGLEISGNLDFRKWWSANFGIDLYSKKVKGTVETSTGIYEFLDIDATIFNARINNSFKATKKLRFQLFAMYRGKDKGLQFERQKSWKMDTGASYTILKGNGTVSARFSDIFKTMNFAFIGQKPTQNIGEFNWESRTVYVGFNYKFGSGKNSALSRKKREKNESQGSGGML